MDSIYIPDLARAVVMRLVHAKCSIDDQPDPSLTMDALGFDHLDPDHYPPIVEMS